MNRDIMLRKWLPDTICLNPIGENADEVSPERFDKMYIKFFESVLEISKANIDTLSGYGELDENNAPQYATLKEFLIGTFEENREDYWKNWKALFQTSVMTKEFFEKYYFKMLEYSGYCEKQRYLVNNNTFFTNMIVTKETVGFLDWERVGITDWLLDFAIMDLNKPYLEIPEKLYAYLKERKIEVENFKERFLCMAYFKGLDTLRWHASIDDEESCRTIMRSISELESRMDCL